MINAALIIFLLCSTFITLVQASVPTLIARFTDQTATLTSQKIAILEQTLQALEARKGSQVVVLIVATTAPVTIKEYAVRVFKKWKLGRKKLMMLSGHC